MSDISDASSHDSSNASHSSNESVNRQQLDSKRTIEIVSSDEDDNDSASEYEEDKENVHHQNSKMDAATADLKILELKNKVKSQQVY